jgi:hypothetical protein
MIATSVGAWASVLRTEGLVSIGRARNPRGRNEEEKMGLALGSGGHRRHRSGALKVCAALLSPPSVLVKVGDQSLSATLALDSEREEARHVAGTAIERHAATAAANDRTTRLVRLLAEALVAQAVVDAAVLVTPLVWTGTPHAVDRVRFARRAEERSIDRDVRLLGLHLPATMDEEEKSRHS